MHSPLTLNAKESLHRTISPYLRPVFFLQKRPHLAVLLLLQLPRPRTPLSNNIALLLRHPRQLLLEIHSLMNVFPALDFLRLAAEDDALRVQGAVLLQL